MYCLFTRRRIKFDEDIYYSVESREYLSVDAQGALY